MKITVHKEINSSLGNSVFEVLCAAVDATDFSIYCLF